TRFSHFWLELGFKTDFPELHGQVHGRAQHHSGRAPSKRTVSIIRPSSTLHGQAHGRASFKPARAWPRHEVHGQMAQVHGRAASWSARALPKQLALRPFCVQSTPDSLLSLHSRTRT
ncbi:unnamed protein product, partial [Linum tenue]